MKEPWAVAVKAKRKDFLLKGRPDSLKSHVSQLLITRQLYSENFRMMSVRENTYPYRIRMKF